jgi:hypothetical protein
MTRDLMAIPVIRLAVICSGLLLAPALARGVAAQSLYLEPAQRASEATVGWSVGPSSDGVETTASFAFDGRIDVGIAFNSYDLDFGDGTGATFREYAPFVRYFAVKEGRDGAPVSLALHGQYFADDFDDEDTGWYVMTGATIYKRLGLSKRLTLYPFVGFSFVGESYSYDGGPDERAVYLARNLGMHAAVALGSRGTTLLRFTVEEQSFRRETYRAARIGIVQRF